MAPRHPPLARTAGGTACARLATDQGPAQLLLSRDVSAAGHQRTQLRHLVTRRIRAHLLDAGVAVAPETGEQGSAATDVRTRIRLSAGLVARWTACRLCTLRR